MARSASLFLPDQRALRVFDRCVEASFVGFRLRFGRPGFSQDRVSFVKRGVERSRIENREHVAHMDDRVVVDLEGLDGPTAHLK